ncbi:MAG: IS30 family transposase [Oscillospiraceae bacterium]|jgi:IS30 family transposase|nr:IS30 family transposase [Oscillospiraceae bacterium]
MIRFTEYIKTQGRREQSARNLLNAGKFKTSAKIEGHWYIDENEPYPKAREFMNLDLAKRRLLESFTRKGLSNAECARKLGVNRSTITRERKLGEYEHLNSDYSTEIRYSADKAQSVHKLNCTALGPPLKLGADTEFAAHVENKLINEKRSPAAILGEIKRTGLPFKTRICTTTLYSYIKKSVFLNITQKELPEGGKRKRKYTKVEAKSVPHGDSIETRPKEANDRAIFGHWEMDTVKGKQGTKETLLVLTERKARMEKIIPILDGTSESVIDALNKLELKLGALFPRIFETITVDNGSENADFEGIERSIFGGKRTKIYYCHPYSSFERGSNENQNRQIRRKIPKGTPLANYSPEYIAATEQWINTNPRKLHQWQTAEQVFNAELLNLDISPEVWNFALCS